MGRRKHRACVEAAQRLEIETAYLDARTAARHARTVRLRFSERSLRGRTDRLTRPERAQLAAVRDELRARGIDLPDLRSA